MKTVNEKLWEGEYLGGSVCFTAVAVSPLKIEFSFDSIDVHLSGTLTFTERDFEAGSVIESVVADCLAAVESAYLAVVQDARCGASIH